MMLGAMAASKVGLRGLAMRTGISRSRLGLILHRDAAKRASMSLVEFQRILAGLDIGLIEAVVTVEIMTGGAAVEPSRHRTVIAMLCEMFRDLPANLIAALDEVPGLDGTEVRAGWAPVLQRAVIKRLVHEVCAVASRRDALGDFDLLNR